MARLQLVGDCWLWTGAIRAHGANGSGEPYGGIRVGATVRLVHRVAYEIANGPIPAGFVIDHLCRNTLCFNPEHLRSVTTRENAAGRDRAAVLDALDRGRRTRWARYAERG